MKTLLRTNKYAVLLLGMGCCLLIVACTVTDKTPRTTGNVEIGTDRIVIHPVIELDENKLDRVLQRFDKKLYRITTFENGKVTKVRGHGFLTASQKAEAAEAQRQGRTHHSHKSVCPNLATCQGQHRSNLTHNEKQLLKELGKLLAKP